MISHGGQSKDGDGKQSKPDGAGNSIPHAGCHPLRVEVDHLIERRDKKTYDDRSGIVLTDSHCLRPQLVLQLLRPPNAFANLVGLDRVQTSIHVVAEKFANLLPPLRKHTGPQIGRPDRVGLIEEELSPQIKAFSRVPKGALAGRTVPRAACTTQSRGAAL